MFHASDALGKFVYQLLIFVAPELVNATVLKVGASGWPLACRTCYRSGALLGIISVAALQFLTMTETTMFGEQSRCTKQQKSEAVSAHF